MKAECEHGLDTRLPCGDCQKVYEAENAPSLDTVESIVGQRYANSRLSPQDGDIVEWDNGERWTVSKSDDLEGPSALHHWTDGGWCHVKLIHRPN